MAALTRRKILAASIGAAAGWWALRKPASTVTSMTTRTARAMGTEVRISIMHDERAKAERAIDLALAELREVERVLSVYDPASQLGILNREGRLDDAHPHLQAVLAASLDMAGRSGGAFDISVQPLWSLYRQATVRGSLPSEEEVRSFRRLVDWRSVGVDGRRVSLKPGMALTFNGIAQGYATDRVAAVLRQQGVTHALVDVGELSAIGEKQPGVPWGVGIQHPRHPDAYVATAPLCDRCLATSGDYATPFSADLAHHHIFDPATGHSPPELSSVTVAAPTAMLADALSTTLMVMGVDRGLEMLSRMENVDAMLVAKSARVLTTGGFPKEAAHV